MPQKNGQKLAARRTRAERSKSPHVGRLLALDLGGAFVLPVAERATVAWYASILRIGTGRRWQFRQLRSADGVVRRYRVERVA